MPRTAPPQEASAPNLPPPAVYGERCALVGEDTGRPFREETAKALTELRNGVERFHKNPMLTEQQKLLSVADRVEEHAKRIRDDLDTQEHLLDRQRAELNEAINSALRAPHPDWDAKAAELRGVLRGLTDDQRFAFLDAVKGTRDEDFVRFAIASVVPAMSGFSFGVHRQMRDTVLALKDPSLLTRPTDLKRRAERLKRCRDGVERSIAELVDFDRVAALRQLIGDSQ